MGPRFVLELDSLEVGVLIGMVTGLPTGDPIRIHLMHRMLDLVKARYAEDARRREALGIETPEGDGGAE